MLCLKRSWFIPIPYVACRPHIHISVRFLGFPYPDNQGASEPVTLNDFYRFIDFHPFKQRVDPQSLGTGVFQYLIDRASAPFAGNIVHNLIKVNFSLIHISKAVIY